MAKEKENLLCLLLFIYGFAFSFFHIIPTFLPSYLKSPITWGDALDFLTPFVVVPTAYLLYSRMKKKLQSLEPSESSSSIQKVLSKIFLALGFLLYVDGHGLHLSSNAIARLLHCMEGSELYKANYLFDEIISHSIWDAGVFLISVGLILLSDNLTFNSLSRRNIAFLSLGAVFYGFAFTVNGIEGQTVVFTFPAAGLGFLIAFLLCSRKQRKGIDNPLLLFFLIGYFLSIILFSVWGISHSGFPQFSELGWI